jgi:hypothetical protein
MNASRTTAIIVGILYIIGTVAGVLSVVVTQSILDDPDYLSKVSANENQLILGALLVLIMGFALAMVPVMMFPISRRHNETLALGYVVFRGALESTAYIGMVISRLALIPLSQEYVRAGASGASDFQTQAIVLLGAHDSINHILIIVFSLGAVMFYSLLYQSKLIPRWLSVWGLIAILLHFSTAFVLMFGLLDEDSQLLLLVNFPIFLQEMVMAVWLIVKGFNPSVKER